MDTKENDSCKCKDDDDDSLITTVESQPDDQLGEIQRNTFVKWINEQFQRSLLPLSLQDLYQDLRDGKILLSLLQVLTGRQIVSQSNNSKDSELVSQLLPILEEYNVKFEGILAEDIVSGDRHACHALVWALVVRWHMQTLFETQNADDLERSLLDWCKESTLGYKNIEIHDFTTSWRDGFAFNAILHKYIPDFFSYESLLNDDNVSRLEHAFNLAHNRLKVPLLLDAKEVDINLPEKRSIMIYLAYLYEATSFSSKFHTTNDGTFRDSKSIFPASSESSLYSRGTSLDYTGFIEAVDGILGWLLDATETLHKQPPIARDTDDLKEQFHTHEKFMVQLTQHQNSIGNILQEGNHLLVEGLLAADEECQVEQQMALLNNRWEELRLKSMDRQTRLQQSLTGKQQQQLDNLSDWMTSMEMRISDSSSGSSSEDNVHHRIDEHKLLRLEVEKQQHQVNNLQSMVVVVDESNSDSAFAALEHQLESLGGRWTNIWKWIEEHGIMLQEALTRWQVFNERLKVFTDWLTETEDVLASMKTINVSDIKEVVDQIQYLKRIENEMDEMMKCFDELNDFGLELVQYIGNDETGIQSINAKLQNCQERWDNLVQQMEQNSQEIARSGIELNISKTSTGSQSVTVSRKGEKPITFFLSAASPLSRPTAAKRPRLESNHKKEFDRQVAALNEWLDQIEVTQEIVTTDPEKVQDRLTIEEQLVLIEDSEKDIKEHESHMEQLRVIGKIVLDEIRSGRESSTDAIDEVMRRLEDRWKRLNDLLLSNISKVNLTNKSKQVYSDLSALKEVVENYEKWVELESPAADDQFMELSRQLEHCRVKLKAFLSHESHIQKISSSAKDLLNKSDLESKDLEKDLDELNIRWHRTHKKLSERQILLSKALQKTPPKSFMDSLMSLIHWLDGVELKLECVSCSVNDIDVMEGKVTICKSVQHDMRDRLSSLEYLNHAGQDLMEKSSSDDRKLRNDLQKLNSKWTKLQGLCSTKIATMENQLQQLNQYKQKTLELRNWVEEMELFLTSEESAIGDINALQAQLLESDGVEDDMQTMKNVLDAVNTSAQTLRPEAEESFGVKFDQDLENLNSRWNKLVDLSYKHNSKLKESIEITQKLSDDMSGIEMWIDDVMKEHLAREYTVHTQDELNELKMKFQVLDEEMRQTRQKTIDELEKRVNELMRRGNAQDLNDAFEKVKIKWTRICQDVETNRNKFRLAEENFTAFKDLILEEMVWFNDLEMKLSKGRKLSADAEELSEELDDLENFLSRRKEEEEKTLKISEVAQALLNDHVMVATVTLDLNAYADRQKKAAALAKERTEYLSESVLQAQNRESQIVEMSQWMTDVSTLLQSRLDADILAGDTPNEFQSLKTDFDQHDVLLMDFEKEVAIFLQENKTEAAERLEQQLTILKKHYAEISVKFLKFQRPVDFDPKMAHIKHVLEELDEQIHVLDISSLDPDYLQTQLDQCLKFYKTMSEIKPEVEYVIKTGRQIVEKKQVDQPEKLNANLDTTKQLYNELGAQVTQGKSVLDQTLKVTRKLKSESESLKDFISNAKHDLLQRDSTKHLRDLEDELMSIKATQSEMAKKQPTLVVLSELVGQLYKIVDESMLTKLDDDIREINSEMNDLTSQTSQRKKILQELAEDLEKAYVEFETTQRELMIWMDNVEDYLNELDSLSAETEEQQTTEQIQQLLVEHGQLITQLDQVRDSAVDIISKSNRYSKMVEPILTLLNQRWQEITNRLKDKQHEMSIKLKKDQRRESFPTTNHHHLLLLLSDNDDDERQLEKIIDQVLHELERLRSNFAKDKTYLDQLSAEDADIKLKEMKDAEDKLHRKVDYVLNHERFAAEQLKSVEIAQQDEIKIQWKKFLSESEHRRLAIILAMNDFSEFRLTAEDLDRSLNRFEQKLLEDCVNEEKLKGLNEELVGKRCQIEELMMQGKQLQSPFARMKAFELLNLLACHFGCLLRQVDMFQKTSSALMRILPRRLQVKKIIFASETSQYVRDLDFLTNMLSDVEQELKMPMIQDCRFDIPVAQEDEFKSVEDALDAIQLSMESAEKFKDQVLNEASEDEKSLIDETLKDLRNRLAHLQKQTADRKKSEENLMISVEQFTAELDNITLWLNETENILNDQISATDKDDQMWTFLDIVKDREGQLSEKQMKLRLLSQRGRHVFYHPDVAAALKERIVRDLNAAVDRWNKVVFVLPKKRHMLEDRLHLLQLLSDQVDKLSLLISTAKIQLEALQHAIAASETSSIQDIKIVQDVLNAGQSDVDRLKHLYDKLQLDMKDTEIGFPEPVRQKVDDVLADWTIIHGLAVILQNTIAKDDNASREVEEEYVSRSTTSTLLLSEKVHPILCPSSSKWPELDEKVAHLDDAIGCAQDKVLLRKVLVGGIQEIEARIKEGKVKMAEIETFYQELEMTCDQLKSESIKSDEERLIVEETVERLREHSDETKTKLTKRNVQLEDMLLECRQFEQMNVEFERWIISLEDESKAQQSTASHTIAALEELIEANKRLQLETSPWQTRVDSLHSMADKLCDEYVSDDTTKLKSIVAQTDDRWNNLTTRLSDQGKLLQNKLNLVYRFDADLNDFLLWLTKVEIVLKHQNNISTNDNADEAQSKQIRHAFKDLQQEIDEHMSVLESLNKTGNEVALGMQASNAESLKMQTADMNERWNRLKTISEELRSRLEMQVNGNSDGQLLQKVQELTNWWTQVDNEISSFHSKTGDVAALKLHKEWIENMKPQLETKGRQVTELVEIDPRFQVSNENENEIPKTDSVKTGNLIESQQNVIVDDIRKLDKKCSEVNGRFSDLELMVKEGMEKMEVFETSALDVEQFLMQKEGVVSKWILVGDVDVDNLTSELNQIKSFHMDLVLNQSKLKTCKLNSIAFLQGCSDKSLIMKTKTKGRLENVEERWSNLESNVEDRIQRIMTAIKESGSHAEHQLSMAVFPPWERSMADGKVPYYINHSCETTQWDHPEMTRIMSSLSELNIVKFSAYRTSMKLRLLQKSLSLDLVSLDKVMECFEQQNLMEFGEKLMTVTDMIKCFTFFYKSVTTTDNREVNVSLSIDLLLNLMLNLFDSSRTGQIQSLSFKVAIFIMCNAHLEEKYRALFGMVADCDGRVNQQRLGFLFNACIHIPKHLGEIAAFGGSNTEPSVRSCFEKAENPSEIEISQFLDWMKLEPQSMVWLPVFYRLSAAENAKHQAKCNVCKECPITGFRYRCLKCFSFDMCQNCFFSGRKAKSHKLTHPMQEYCTTTTSSEDMRDFTKMFKNKFRSKRYFKKHPRLGYLPVQSLNEDDSAERTQPLNIAVTSCASRITMSAPTANSRSSTPSTNSNSSQNHEHPSANKKISRASPPQPSSQTNSISTLDMHSRLEMYANRLAEVEKRRRETTPDWDDEHHLIAQYCQSLHGNHTTHTLQSPMQIMMAVDADQRSELESMIKALEEENRLLKLEYDQLKQAHREEESIKSPYDNVTEFKSNNDVDSRDAEMIAEARLLRQHKGRLETRMKILEDHNFQLDSQLNRLRQLLAEHEQPEPEMRIVTYPIGQSTTSNGLLSSSQNPVPQRVPPSFASSTRNSGHYSIQENGMPVTVNGNLTESFDRNHQDSSLQHDKGKNNIDNLFQVAEEVGRAVETLVNIMTDDERHAEEEKDLAAKQRQRKT